MFYEIRFDGNAVKDIRREYKSDLHAINAAYRALGNQPGRPEDGKKRAGFAEIYECWDGDDLEYLVTVSYGGSILVKVGNQNGRA